MTSQHSGQDYGQETERGDRGHGAEGTDGGGGDVRRAICHRC